MDATPTSRPTWSAPRSGCRSTTTAHEGPRSSLALIRMPAAEPDTENRFAVPQPGRTRAPLGWTWSSRAAAIGDPPYTDEVLARFDLVGFDPGSIHRSTPLLCFRSLEQALRIVPPVPFPVTPEEEAMFERADRALNRACQRRGGPIVDHMATADVARDLDLLRQCGGRPPAHLSPDTPTVPSSGSPTPTSFPRRVRALVLDRWSTPSPGPRAGATRRETEPVFNRLGIPAGAQATLEEFFRLCDAAGPEGLRLRRRCRRAASPPSPSGCGRTPLRVRRPRDRGDGHLHLRPFDS